MRVEKGYDPWEPPREVRLPDKGSMRGHQLKTPTNKQVQTEKGVGVDPFFSDLSVYVLLTKAARNVPTDGQGSSLGF